MAERFKSNGFEFEISHVISPDSRVAQHINVST